MYRNSKNIKTKNDEFDIDSIILKESKRKIEFLEIITKWIGYKKLLVRGSRNGMKSKNFHDKCDNQG